MNNSVEEYFTDLKDWDIFLQEREEKELRQVIEDAQARLRQLSWNDPDYPKERDELHNYSDRAKRIRQRTFG